MKMRVFFAMAVAVGMLASGSVAHAAFAVSVGDTFKLNASLYKGNIGGGEFGAFIKNTADHPGTGYPDPLVKGDEDFRTFCAEFGEHFSNNEELKVASITSATVATGHALTVQAAWLFREFSLLKTTGYAGTIGATLGVAAAAYAQTDDDANLLQKAIWHFLGQDPFGLQSSGNNRFVKAAEQVDYTGVTLGDLGVQILNMKSLGGAKRQDQLIYDYDTPEFNTNPVPEPMSAVLWMMGLSGAAVVRRRRSPAKSDD